MKKNSFLLFCLLLAPAAIFGSSFEGKIRVSAKSPKRDQPAFVDYSIKEGLLRMDMTSADGSTSYISIWNMNKHELTNLMPDKQAYIAIKTADIPTVAQAEAPHVQFEKTGGTETILGYPTTKYLYKDTVHGTSSEVWAAEGLGTFMTVRSAVSNHGIMSPLEKELAARGVFPLRIINHNSSGAETSRVEAVSIDKKTIPDDTFTVPSDYHPFDPGELPGGF